MVSYQGVPHARGMKTLALVLPLLMSSVALAQADPPSDAPAVAVGVGAHLSNFGAGALVDLRLRTARELQLGVDVSAGRDWDAFVGGHAVHDARRFEVGWHVLAPVWRRGSQTFSLGARVHTRRLASAESSSNLAEEASWAVGVDLRALLHAALGDRGMLRGGVVIPVGFEVEPTFHADTTGSAGALLTLGGAVALTDHLALSLDVDAGGAFGADGDGVKFLARGQLMLRVTPGGRWLRF